VHPLPGGLGVGMSPLRLYRQLLGLAQQLPADKRGGALQQIRVEFRKYAHETDTNR
jgi:hypothetical protein